MPRPPSGYLDAASGQPLNPAAREALAAAVEAGWADPVRLYREGRQAALLLDAARESIASRVGARPDELLFTGSGPQALHLGIGGALGGQPAGQRAPLVISAVEHSAALAEADGYADSGGEVRLIGVDRQARVRLEEFVAALPGSALACLQAANHEVGTCQPLVAAADACSEVGVPLLVDATTALGRVDPPTGWSILTGSAHTWGGPIGVGILAVRRSVRWRAPGPQDERGPELVNVPLAVAAARGLEWADEHRAADAERARSLTERIRASVARDVPDSVELGDPEDRLPYLTAFSCLYVDGESLVLGLDRAGFAVSSGSSCVADTRRPSHVLAAMGALTQGNVRVSLPFGVTDETVDGFLATLPGIVREVRTFFDAPMES
ncbi:MAG: cysteine desulfurase family protein [Candidatus Nanopelagicales bacterium]